MSRTYSKRTCRCGQEVSSNGLSWHNHMMGHVRKGEVTKMEYSTRLKAATNLRSNYYFIWVDSKKDA
jgi:hypothetical protein